jgi:hypothetical protein
VDAFKQLYTFMEVPPLFCFYDFACGLSEYALNREPLFFKSTGWYHDIFHGLVSPCCAQNVQVCVVCVRVVCVVCVCVCVRACVCVCVCVCICTVSCVGCDSCDA